MGPLPLPATTVINNLADAAAFFNETKCKNEAILITTHKGAKGPIAYVFGHDAKQYYVMFKKEWFYKFGRIFKSKSVEPGIGQSFNFELLQDAASQYGIMVVVMPNTDTYFVKAKKALKYIVDHGSKRIPPLETKEEGSIPMSMLSKDSLPHEPANTFKLTDTRT